MRSTAMRSGNKTKKREEEEEEACPNYVYVQRTLDMSMKDFTPKYKHANKERYPNYTSSPSPSLPQVRLPFQPRVKQRERDGLLKEAFKKKPPHKLIFIFLCRRFRFAYFLEHAYCCSLSFVHDPEC